ncbi:MAG TPA: hypothetical protein VGJ02_07580 [Pyrinomonadaceae bacterium]|jgi:hypothetical protein
MATKTKEPVRVDDSELDDPLWSVVSFERTEAANLTYSDAVAKIAELEKQHVPGLCIITDDAAARTS